MFGLDDALVGGIAGGLGSIGGSIISSITGHSAQAREYERQKEFAQNGIRWKVADAKAAGIHPLYALGAHAASYSPQAVSGTDYGLSQMGQNISRAIEAKQTPAERELADLQRENAKLQNDLLKSQIGRTDAETSKLKSDNLWSELDYVTRQARLSEKAVSTAQTQRPPAMSPTNDNLTGTYADLASGIVPYVVGDTIMEFPPEDVADMMEDPKMMALWKSAIEIAWANDPKLREHVIRKLPEHMRKGLSAGTHELVRVPGYGLNYRKKKPKPKYSAPRSGGMRGFYGG